MDPWYAALVKPAWTPAPATIGLIWTVLYPVIIATYGIAVFQMIAGRMSPWVALPILLNVLANVAFTPIQFGLRNLPLASADILLVLVTIVWCMFALWPYSRWYAVALLPDLVWVALATVLQLSITFSNR
jgi:benzodiazapine receptor